MPLANPRISVVVATYNSGATVQKCINSVAGQTYTNKELVVIDGGSSDNTVSLLKQAQQDISYWVSEPDKGVYHAWNKGLAHASGEWVHFLGSDDRYRASDVLERVAEELARLGPGIGLAYGQVARVTPDGEVVEYWGEPWEVTKPRLIQRMSIPHPATFHRRSLWQNLGKFDESFRIAGDYEFILRAVKGNEACFLKDIVVTAARCDGISSVPETAFERNAECAKARRLNGLPPHPLSALGPYLENLVYGSLYRVFGNRGAVFVQNMYRRLTGRAPMTVP